MSGADEWDKILGPGGEIIWQGQPVPGFEPTVGSFVISLFGGIFTILALFWMAMVSNIVSTAPVSALPEAMDYYWLAGLPFLAIGLGIIASVTIWPEYRQKRTWYTLTNKHAYIATNIPITGKRLKPYSIQKCEFLELKDGPLQSVFFAKETRKDDDDVHTINIGFERIADGHEVYRFLRNIRAATEEQKDNT